MKQNVLNTDLTGKVAVVTGAGGVLCSYFAKVLARAGAKVALLDLNEEAAKQFAQEIVEEGGVAKAYACNVIAPSLGKVLHETCHLCAVPVVENPEQTLHVRGFADVHGRRIRDGKILARIVHACRDKAGKHVIHV